MGLKITKNAMSVMHYPADSSDYLVRGHNRAMNTVAKFAGWNRVWASYGHTRQEGRSVFCIALYWYHD